MRERSTAMATKSSSSNTSGSPSRRCASGHSASPSRPTGAAGGSAALLLVDAEKAVAFEEARRKFAMYGRQNAHVSHLTSSRKGTAASAQTGGGGSNSNNNMKPMRKRAMVATATTVDGDDATVLKNSLLLQENGELALHLDDLNYRLDGVAANCGSNGDDKERMPEQLYAGAQNVVELARLLRLEPVQMVIKLASPSQNLYARIRDVMMLLSVRRFSGDGVEQQSLGLAVAVLTFVLTQSPEADEFFTSDTLDLIVDCLQTIDGDGDNAETRAAQLAQLATEEKAPLVAVEEHTADQPMPLKKTCLKRKARPLHRQRSSSVSSGDDAADQRSSSTPEYENHQEQFFAQIKSLLVDQEAFCINGQVMIDLSIVDVLAVVLHNLLQMDKPQEQQLNHQVSRSLYHRSHRDNASVTFSTVLARKRQLVGNRGLDALIRILTIRFQHLKTSFLSDFSCSSSASFVHSCSLRSVQAILRVVDQASFLAVEVQQYLSNKRGLFVILLESIDRLSELCWGTRQARIRRAGSSAAADMPHLVAEVLLVSMRVLINLTHHNEAAAHQVHKLNGTEVLFRAFCKLWGFVEVSKRSADNEVPSANQGSSFSVVFEEKLLFDALLMCLSALTNCIEFSEENREALSSVVVPSGGIDGLQQFKTSAVCELLTHFFLSKVQSYLRIIEMSESQGESNQFAGIENAASLEWVPEDVVLGGCTSLLLGCLMENSTANSSAILAMLPDGSPRLLLRALGAFVALHSQIGALTPEVGDSVLQVERTLKSFLSEHESGFVTPAEPAMMSQTLKITISVEKIQSSHDGEELPSQDTVSQSHAENGAFLGTKEIHTPPATAFKLQKWKKVCSAVDSDSDSGDGDAAKAPAEKPVKPARSPNAQSPKSLKGRSPNVRSPSVRLPKKEKKNGKAALTRSPAASLLVLSASRSSGKEAPKQTQSSPQRMKRARQLVSELADKLLKVSDDSSSFSGFSTAMTSTEDLSQQHDDDEWHLDFSSDQKLPPKNKTGKATPPIRILSRDSSPMTPGARKRARIGKLAHRSPNRPKLSLALTAVATISVSQQQRVTVEDSSQVLDEAISSNKTVSSSFENALKRKRKAAKPPPSTSATDDATAIAVKPSSSSSSRTTQMRSMHWHAEWPSADEKHELQSLKAKICRRSVLGSLYFVWVCGITGVAVTGAYSLYAITRSVLSLNAIPVPRSVAYFLTFLVLYETYHWLTPGLHRWDAMRRFLHYMFTKYPYFRRTVCLFDEELDANAIKNEGEDAPASREVPSDTSEADSFFVKPDDKSLFAFHPHGILSCGFGMNGVHHTKFAKSNTRWLVAENLFWFPIMRDLLHWMDSSNVKKETFVELMKKNQNIGFLPGGFEDATLYKRGTHRVFIKNRFGFIKLALQFGYKVYPVYTFGEEHTFDALPYFLHLRLKLNALKLPGAIFMGSPWCFFMPRSNVDLVTVVGKPLELPTIKHPTKQDVQKYHALYVSSLHALFEKHKAKYAVDPDATLEMY